MNLKECSVLFKQLASLLKAGVPLNKAIKILAIRSKKKINARLVRVSLAIEEGISFSEAMRDEGVITREAENVLKVSETSATLEQALIRLAGLYDTKIAFWNKIRKAVTYPIVIVLLSLMSLAGMILFILPVFSGLFIDSNIRLPLITRIAVSLPQYVWVLAVLIVLMSPIAIKALIDIDLRMKLPVIGRITRLITASDLCYDLSCQLRSGAPIISSLNEISKGNKCREVISMLKIASERLEKGSSFSAAFHGSPLLNDIFFQFTSIGEESGDLAEMLSEAGNKYAEEAESKLNSVTVYIEPLSTLFVGAMVAFVALSMMLPLFSMVNSLL